MGDFKVSISWHGSLSSSQATQATQRLKGFFSGGGDLLVDDSTLRLHSPGTVEFRTNGEAAAEDRAEMVKYVIR